MPGVPLPALKGRSQVDGDRCRAWGHGAEAGRSPIAAAGCEPRTNICKADPRDRRHQAVVLGAPDGGRGGQPGVPQDAPHPVGGVAVKVARVPGVLAGVVPHDHLLSGLAAVGARSFRTLLLAWAGMHGAAWREQHACSPGAAGHRPSSPRRALAAAGLPSLLPLQAAAPPPGPTARRRRLPAASGAWRAIAICRYAAAAHRKVLVGRAGPRLAEARACLA